jgi:hypothetical protein
VRLGELSDMPQLPLRGQSVSGMYVCMYSFKVKKVIKRTSVHILTTKNNVILNLRYTHGLPNHDPCYVIVDRYSNRYYQ